MKHNRRLVPWFSMAEFDQLKKQIYSSDTAAQIKGLELLLTWKARCPWGIPSGAQLTAVLLQVCLKDRELWPQIVSGELPPHNEQYLQSIYSMAVIRVLSHLEDVFNADRGTELNYVARKLQFPDWLVHLRNRTTHHSTMAPLDLLRNAADFFLNWILEHYWKEEAKYTVDLVLNKKMKDVSVIVHTLEMFQAAMIYSKAGYTTYKDIVDADLRKELLDLRLEYDSNDIEKMWMKLENRGQIIEKNEMEEARLVIIKKLVDYLEEFNLHSELVDLLLEGDGFLPSPDFLALFNTKYDIWRLETDSLPVYFISLWTSLLEFIPQDKVVPTLLRKLIVLTHNENESSHRQRMAALWAKELSLSLLKVKEFNRLAASQVNLSYRKVMEILEEKDPNMRQVATLKLEKVPGSLTGLDMLSDVLNDPNKWTKIFLPSVLDLMDPPLPKQESLNLRMLVDLYTQELSPSDIRYADIDSPVNTISNLMSEKKTENKNTEEMDIICIEDDPVGVQSDWIQCEENVDWSSCPLGRLPWQSGDSTFSLDLACNTTWQSAQASDKHNLAETTLPGFFHEEIDLERTKRKSPCIINPSLEQMQHTSVNMVKKAFYVALYS